MKKGNEGYSFLFYKSNKKFLKNIKNIKKFEFFIKNLINF